MNKYNSEERLKRIHKKVKPDMTLNKMMDVTNETKYMIMKYRRDYLHPKNGNRVRTHAQVHFLILKTSPLWVEGGKYCE